jgi:hypothetical protein
VIVYAVCAVIWFAGYRHWILRLPLLVPSLAIADLCLNVPISPVAGFLATSGAVTGFVLALWPARWALKSGWSSQWPSLRR